ncbi:MAG TPA: SURF1 family protein [Gemmatimonadales bacterium]|nr:SURF1 family protein [Gemmatimonadales bacterium]
MTTRSRAFFLIISLVVAAVCVRLGFWQTGKLKARRAANAIAYAARSEPAVLLPGRHDSLGGRRIIASGSYDHTHDFVVRGREYLDTPGVHIVTPLRLTGSDTAVLVLRGFVPAADALTARPDTLEEPGPQIVRGIALALAGASDSGAPRDVNGTLTWRRTDLAMAARLPYPILPILVFQAGDPTLPRWPRRLDPPVLDEGPYESYAIQWFAFALIFGGGGIIWVLPRQEKRDNAGPG